MKPTVRLLLIALLCAFSFQTNAQCLQLIDIPADTSIWAMGSSQTNPAKRANYLGDTVVLNHSSNSANNYIYNQFPVTMMGTASTFSASYDFRIDSNSACSDGLTFWFFTSSLYQMGSTSNEGGQMGFCDTTAGFALAFRTIGCVDEIYMKKINSNNYNWSGGNGNDTDICTPLNNQMFLTDGNWHHVVVNYNQGNITASFDGGVVTMSGFSPIYGTGHFGFMATNGGGYSRKSLKNIQVCADLGTPTTSATLFGNFINRQCNGPLVTTVTFNYSASHNLKTFWGDGTMTAASSFNVGMTGGYVQQNHNYNAPGTYTIRQELYSGSTLIDTMSYNYENIFCATLPVKFYYDNSNNCYKESNEDFITQPVLVEVDSNNVPVDTISATSGFYYDATGNIGDIYTFKVLEEPGNMYTSCPVNATISETLTEGVFVYPIQYFGLNCSSGNDFDLAITAETPVTGAYDQWGNIYVSNAYCAPHNATVTLTFSPQYIFTGNANPAPTSTTANSLTWNVSNLSAQQSQPVKIHYQVDDPGAPLAFNDTVHSSFTVSPTTGDMDITNNIVIIVDTVKSGCDPNYIEATPECTENSSTPFTSRYSIHFENTGNDTTRNIYVLDTLPTTLNASTLKIVSASHPMNIYKYQAGGHSILKFDFPNIYLPDSSHHQYCTGYVTFDISTSSAIPYGSNIPNKAGIYFDGNDVVMTNEFKTRVGFCSFPVGITENSVDKVDIYPNPANNMITIKANNKTYDTYKITNAIGQSLMTGAINENATMVHLKTLPAGLYYISISGKQHTIIKKVIKQ